MAQRVNVVIESDLSGKPDAATVRFGLDGTGYEIDLTDK
jgi:Lsr2